MTEFAHNAQTGDRIRSSKRLVIKLGSALIVNPDGSIRAKWLASLVADLEKRRSAGCDIIIVSSGAVAIGTNFLGLTGNLKLEEKQAAAAVGQPLLMDAWRDAFGTIGATPAQILLTLADMENRRRYLNARGTIDTLAELGAIAIINENDTTATDEIRYGDNDRLAAHVAQLASADVLLMLSDIDGLYTGDPRTDKDAAHIAVVDKITDEIDAMAGGANTARGAGSGGMKTKLDAARIAIGAGCDAIIAKGESDHPITAILETAPSTLFPAASSPDRARRNWIAGRINPAGRIHIDDGAQKALRSGASLLAAGVTKVEGNFNKGDAVQIIGPDGTLLGQGLIGFESRDADAIKGLQSKQAEKMLGYARACVIHRDDMALTGLSDQ